MPRAATLFVLALSLPAAALAQDAAEVDFVLRGTEVPFDEPVAAVEPAATTPPATPPRRPPTPRDDEEDPFAAPGVALGSFVLRSTIDIGVTASDNIHLSRLKQSAVGWLVAPDIDLRSDWQRHEIAFELRGTALFYDDEGLNELDGEARLSGRYDITDGSAIDAAIGAFSGTDDFTDPDLPQGAAERPAFRGLTAELGASHTLGRIGLRLAGGAERIEYEDVPLVGGGTAGLDDRNNTEVGLRLRASYRASEALQPFVEAAVGRVDYDRTVDTAGFRRSGDWRELTGGLVFDLGPKLSGEVAAGYRSEQADDPRLEPLDGIVASAALLWSPRRLTDVRLELSTETARSTLPGVAGSHIRSALVAVERRIRDDLELEAGLFFSRESFVGLDLTEDTLGGYAEIAYHLNRYASLVGRYEYERLDSSALANPVAENVASVRVRLRR
ncbi:MAG TPA: outer membrane beta-barrel protein [Afifellaceae bacterium]|nr:outer membrane beta-barrel protein [Afifellaceae bacterium]